MMLVSSAAAVLFEDAPAQAAGHAETEQQEKQSRCQPMHVSALQTLRVSATNIAPDGLIRRQMQGTVL
jgi:hypothetical protein